MNTRNRRILAGVGLAVLAAGGYLAHTLFAAQAQGVLAQEPMNVQTRATPAFIMAVDDSGSMNFERMFPGGDGRMRWNSNTNSFFNNDGSFFSVGSACANNSVDCYLYLYPHAEFNKEYSPGRAIPPLDIYGFARSHVYNASYFNPAVTYRPWTNADGTLWPNASITQTRADPRSGQRGYNAVYNMTVNRAETSEKFQFVSGMRIPDLSGTGNEYYVDSWRDGGWKTAAISNTGNTTYAISYFPATFYLPAAAPTPDGYKTDDASRPVIKDACGPGCDLRRYQIKSGNYSSPAAYNAAIQNFSN